MFLCLKRLLALAPAVWLAAALVGMGPGLVQAGNGAPAEAGSQPSSGKPGVAVSEAGTVDLNAQGADLRQVLQLLSTQSRINIVASKEVSGTVTADLYGVTFNEALDAVLKSAGFVYVRDGNFVYVYTPKQLEDIEAARRKLETKVFHLNYITCADTKVLITPMLSKEGLISTTPPAAQGVASAKDQAGGNALANEDVLVVHDFPEVMEKVTSLIRELDVPPQQVMIEATMLRATLDESNALGIDFNVLAGVDFGAVGQAGDLPPAVKIPVNANAAVFNSDVNTGMPSGGLSIGFISSNVSFVIRALETVTDVAVMANPKLLVMNKQRGEVLVGNRDGYLTTTYTETTSTQTVQFLETGTRLIVRPYIYTDGSVRLEIHPEDSTGGVTAQNLPFEETTEVTTNVRVQDGHTIIIGGLFREKTTNSRTQIPGLGNIPIAGTLFRNRSDATKREEVIILLTPHIIKQNAAEAVGELAKDQIERFRAGMRQGMLWFGRDRLAQAHMNWARQHLAAGQYDRALWDVELALSLESRMEEALQMKEQLTRQAIWAHEPRHSAVKYVVQAMMMQELGKPVGEVIPPLRPRDPAVLDEKVKQVFGIEEIPQLPLKDYGLNSKDMPVEPLPDEAVPGTPKPDAEASSQPSGGE